ncbi:MAG: hypothetical protein HFI29_05600 [Lachnospiraceae bacterium]|jgi:hypothetical protein|nr:hypothetical protein [Lachnospiraceae bacterium]
MKKKTIEKIPYLKLPGVKRGKAVEYVAVTAVKEIGEEPHLFVEVYRNKKECKEIPVVRTVLTKKDFGTFFPEAGTWSRGRIERNTWSNRGLIWRENDKQIRKSAKAMAEENVLYSSADLVRIQKFFAGMKAWSEEEWWEYISKKQEEITVQESQKKSERKRKRRQQALKEREENTPELPEKEILEYADKVLFYTKHYLYYRKHGSRAVAVCSKCGGVTDARWKTGLSYESQFERVIEEPRMDQDSICPMCKARGTYMPQGRAKSFYKETRYLFLGQKYKENGMVFRYIEVEKEWQLELTQGEKEKKMYGASEKLTGIELARVYFEPGKKVQKDYQKYSPWSGENFWDDCNLSGFNSINIRKARIMPETYTNMTDTFLQYSALEDYQKKGGDTDPVEYLERYIHTPQIEMLIKLGLIHVVEELVRCHYGIVANEQADRVDTFLGIRKERVKQLIKYRGDLSILKVMQMEKCRGKNWTDEQIEQLAELGLEWRAGTFLEHMSIQKLLNQVKKYAGCEYGTMCSTAISMLQQAARTYLDYLNMRAELGYDLKNTVYLFPRDLHSAHMKMVTEHNKIEADKRLKEAADMFPLIKKRYRRLRKRFYFEDKEFLIRPARSAEEIVMEGRILHHCVGGDDYLGRHNEGRAIILLLRCKGEPEIPYITVEIDSESLNILQWYGANDKKTDQERMQKWLNNYTTRLKCGGMEAGQEGKMEVKQRVLAYA